MSANDRTLLLELLDRYCSALDRRDWPALESCFHPQIRYSLYGGNVQANGWAEVYSHIGKVAEHTSSMHVVANAHLDIQGDAAEGVINGLAYLHQDDRSRVLMRGLRYTDRYARGPAGWLITERRHEALWQVETPAVPLTELRTRTFQR